MEVQTMGVLEENKLSLSQMARELGCSDSKIYKIYKRGATAIDGRTVYLETILTEAGRKSSLEAYHRFHLELNTDRSGESSEEGRDN